jgi:hypothetical protein
VGALGAVLERNAMTAPEITRSEAARIMGRAGGLATARKLTKKERSESARRASKAAALARKRKALNGSKT